MRFTLFPAALFAILLAGMPPLMADTVDTGSSQQASPISFLSSADQQKFIVARSRMLADHPEIQAEGEELKRAALALRGDSSTPEQKASLQSQIQAYQQTVRLAMLKEDPSLGPILDQIDQHLAESRAQASGAVQMPTLPQPPAPPKATNELTNPVIPPADVP